MPCKYAEEDAIPNDWRTRQPGFAIWLILAVPRVLLSALFFSIYYLPSSLRQSRGWSYRQALSTQAMKIAFRITTELGFTQTLSLDAGGLDERWVIINPAPADAYPSILLSNEVKPEKIGACWYPDTPIKARQHYDVEDENSFVVLAFHSGSFLWFTGRPDDSGPIAGFLNRKLGHSTRSFWVQYRLAGGNKNPTPYPGPMQDAITAYIYLVKTLGISPRRIILVGDSSGATVAMALLRYLVDNKDNAHLVDLPPPKACLMFSPSIDYSFEGDSFGVDQQPNSRTDYCDGRLMAWGARAFAPPDQVPLDDPYLSPALHPFATPVPIFVQAGGAELLCDSIRGFAEAMGSIPGNRIEYMEVSDVPHDIYVAGTLLGWGKEQEDIVDAAANFVARH